MSTPLYRFDPESAVISGSRVMLKVPEPAEAQAVASFFERNIEFHRPWVPIRKAFFYAPEFWHYSLGSNIELARDDKALRLFVYNWETDAPIGHIYFDSIVRGAGQHCTLSYAICERFQRQGLMKEALKLGIQHIFDAAGLHRIQAAYLPRNTRSARLLESLEFQLEGVARQYINIAGTWEDHKIVSLINAEWSDSEA